ncbi:Panacea domain-containing protein [Fictibacillus sp. S7]|uniref:Panacea domain-containing protein n=1 Tax=Fictibacillus sp. S7 TaxID=2212476 RepID=UPI00101174C6|nr:type II toxin-antitoxin system antitoxin SocA domain-containing protein [Fictibacillus sp. S7]RXZ00946.1 hypothetical protein DMO16_15550 [Fictibacillus sp. S7]
MLTAQQVAQYFIFMSIPGTKENITNLKLQKLLYFAQGEYLAEHGPNTPLFEDEIKAWAHGPVVPEVYFKYSDYKFMEISKEGTENIIDIIENVEEQENRYYLDILERVWNQYKQYNGKELENITHENGPWKDIRGDLPPFISTNTTITKKSIFEYFASPVTA